MAKETLEVKFGKLQTLATETKGLVFTNTYSKKNGKWGIYIFATKKKFENKDLGKAVDDAVAYIEEKRVKEGKGFKLA